MWNKKRLCSVESERRDLASLRSASRQSRQKPKACSRSRQAQYNKITSIFLKLRPSISHTNSSCQSHSFPSSSSSYSESYSSSLE